MIYHPAIIKVTSTAPISRSNFETANRKQFKLETRLLCSSLSDPTTGNLGPFCKRNQKIALRGIPGGYKKEYIPGWDTYCNQLDESMEKAKSLEEKQSTKYNLINYIIKTTRENWIKTIESTI